MDNKTIQKKNISTPVLEKAENKTDYIISKDKENEYLRDSEELERKLLEGKVKPFKKTSALLKALRSE